MARREPHHTEIEEIYRQAVSYQYNDDIYHAVKLAKKVIKLAPDWSAPFSLLSLIYKNRNEWHPAMYYSRKAITLNPFDEEAWKNLAISATALKKWLTVRKAWNHLGYDFPEKNKIIKMNLGNVPVRINPNDRPEIIWATKIDPARAYIASVPQPSSERRFRDLILIDHTASGYFVKDGKRMPVYNELQLLKPSQKWTFIAFLDTNNPMDVLALDQLCAKAKLGFDNWSKATRHLLTRHKNSLPEYFDESMIQNYESDKYLIAISAEWQREVREILEAWKVVTLKGYSGLRCVLRW
jgi:tetratricopeptide (TPR) repeat protein